MPSLPKYVTVRVKPWQSLTVSYFRSLPSEDNNFPIADRDRRRTAEAGAVKRIAKNGLTR